MDHRRVVGEPAGGAHVVGRDQEGRAALALDVGEHLAQQREADAVDPGIEVVDDHDPRLERERAGDRHPLAHPGGELLGHRLGSIAQPDHLQVGHRGLVDARLGPVVALAQGEGDVLVHVEREEQAAGERKRALEHDRHPLAQPVELRVGDLRQVLALDLDRALVGVDEPDDVADRDRLAGPGRPEQDGDLPRPGRSGRRRAGPPCRESA